LRLQEREAEDGRRVLARIEGLRIAPVAVERDARELGREREVAELDEAHLRSARVELLGAEDERRRAIDPGALEGAALAVGRGAAVPPKLEHGAVTAGDGLADSPVLRAPVARESVPVTDPEIAVAVEEAVATLLQDREERAFVRRHLRGHDLS